MPATTISSALEIEVTTPAGRTLHAALCGEGNRLDLVVDEPRAFAGRGDAASIRSVADFLARQDVAVRVLHEGRVLVTIGAVTAPWWQRRATGSRHIRLGSVRGAWTSLRARVADTEQVLPEEGLAPPGTLWPPAPTFARRIRRPVGTTHDPARGGGARLVLAKQDVWGGERQPIFWLNDEVTTIGASSRCDVVLPGLDHVHARIEHDDQDEFVLLSPGAVSRVHGAAVERAVLRTGSRVELGRWTLVFAREEWADHGRPHGGRIGGELGHQRPQPPREVVQRGGRD